MRKRAAVALMVILPVLISAQPQFAVIDSMKQQLQQANTDKKKVELLGYLCRTLMNADLAEADKYGQQMILVAEQSRDRELMVDALLVNGERFSYLSGRRDNIDKAISYYQRGLELARKNKMDKAMSGLTSIFPKFREAYPMRKRHSTTATRPIHIREH